MAEKKTLTTLVSDQVALDNLLLEVAGNITDPEAEAAVSEWMAEITSGIANKVDGYEFRMEAIRLQAEKFKARAEMFSAAAKALTNLENNLKDRLKYSMIQMDKNEISGNYYRYKLQNSKASVHISDETLLPAEYLTAKMVYTPNKTAIKDAIEEGRTVPGASLERGFTLRTYVNKGE
jgi:hypothetical protein